MSIWTCIFGVQLAGSTAALCVYVIRDVRSTDRIRVLTLRCHYLRGRREADLLHNHLHRPRIGADAQERTEPG
jgi:hypothetical protein